MSFITKEAQRDINEDIKIDRFKLVEESARTPALLSKYLVMYLDTKKQVKKTKMKLDVLYKTKRLYYTGQAEDDVYERDPLDKKVLRQDVDMWVSSDKDIQKLKEELDQYEIIVEFLEKIIREIERRTFTIKNMQEMIKFESGG